MVRNKFKEVSANENNNKWNNLIKREGEIYTYTDEIRSPFERDYNRILNTNAYNRLKHKTQVFYSPENDHICTRIGHVNYVESISYTISNILGLNTELTRAIACGHDVGHGPFGHKGEKILSEISKRDIGESFWHEKNGLNLVDNIELLVDYDGNKRNLNLTYAVRDGIISHCGEIDENSLKPRNEAIDLNKYTYPNEYAPYTWEGCVVKISDKISYLGVDIEDAIEEGLLDENNIKELNELLGIKENLNNSSIVNKLVRDICQNSSPEEGIKLSDEGLALMNKIKEYNYKYIYLSERMKPAEKYFELVINQIYDILKNCYDGENTYNNIMQENNRIKTNNIIKEKKYYPGILNKFGKWLEDYCYIENMELNNETSATIKTRKIMDDRQNRKNKIIFDIKNEKEFYSAIICYIAGMTDKYAIDTYNEIIHF